MTIEKIVIDFMKEQVGSSKCRETIFNPNRNDLMLLTGKIKSSQNIKTFSSKYTYIFITKLQLYHE